MYTPVLVVGPAVGPADVSLLVRRLAVLLSDGPVDVVLCDVASITEPDAGTLDGLARLQLAARRLGCRIALRGAHHRLRDLLALTGFGVVLPIVD